MTAESALAQLLQSPESRAVALVGTWGRGKTHLWRRLVATTPNQARSKQSYVSLFGVNTLDDLKLAIFQQEIAAGPPPTQPTRWQRFLNPRAWKAAAKTASQIDYPSVGNLNQLYRAVVFTQVKNRLICFDDFERKGKDLNIEEVLGLITFLCEERSCAVVLILNDATLDGIADWNKYREKVFHSEVSYRPSTQACIEIIFGSSNANEWHEGAREVLTQLDVSNMRIMSRIKASLEPLSQRYPQAPAQVKRQIGKAVALYSYCHNGSGERAPPVNRALRYPYHRFAQAGGTDTRNEDEKIWDAQLSKVDFYPDDLDSAVVAYVQDGYPDFDLFDQQVARLISATQLNSADRSFSEAWAAYHNSFEDDTDHVIAKFEASFPAVAPTTHAMNANSSIALMRKLGRDDLADTFISAWIEPRRGERRGELSVRAAETFGPLTDQAFIRALAEAEAEETTTPDFSNAMEIVASGQGGLNSAMETIARADIEQIIVWFKLNPGRISRSFFNTSMRFHGDAHVEHAQLQIREALRRIGETSSINNARVSSILRAIDDP